MLAGGIVRETERVTHPPNAARGLRSSTLDHCGFTLVELLLAISIGSVVMAAVYATFNTAIGSQQRIQRAAHASQASRYFMELVRRDVKQLSGRVDTMFGSSQQLGFITNRNDGSVQKISYHHSSGQGQVLRSVLVDEVQTETIAYEGVKSLGFRYLIDGNWHTQTIAEVLPQAIECAIEIGSWVQRFTITLEVENVPVES